MSFIGYQSFIGEDDFSIDFIEEGKALMKRGVFLFVYFYLCFLVYVGLLVSTLCMCLFVSVFYLWFCV